MRYFFTLSLCIIAFTVQGQQFNTLHDYAAGYEFGTHIFYDSLADDGQYPYVVLGYGKRLTEVGFDAFCMRISADGQNSTVTSALVADSNKSYLQYPESSGKKLPNGNFVVPLCTGNNHPAQANSGGLIVYSHQGDTVLTRNYSGAATSGNSALADLDLLPGGGYILAGLDSTRGWLVRTDAIANKVSEFFYPQQLSSVQTLSTNRFLIGGYTKSWKYYPRNNISSNGYVYYQPHFSIIDSSGTIVRDTIFSSGYIGSIIRKDANGGFYHTGVIDTFVSPSETGNPYNFPPYIAHLDTNFRIQWITRFRDGQHRFNIYNAKQLRNGSYIVIGAAHYYSLPTNPGVPMAWAARISTTGQILWSKPYHAATSTSGNETLIDVVERNDGSFVFCGSGGQVSNYMPAFVWTLTVDSNGCEICAPTVVQPLPAHTNSFTITPNPVSQKFNISTNEAGTLYLYNMQGQLVSRYLVEQGTTSKELSGAVTPGIYNAVFIQQRTSIRQYLKVTVAP